MSSTVEASIAETGNLSRDVFATRLRLFLDRWASPLVLLLCAGLTLALYARVLGTPYFFDDAVDMPRTEATGFLGLLGPLKGYAYYRPVLFIIYKLVHTLTGGYEPHLLHALPVLSHIAAGWLLFLIVRRLTGSLWSVVPAVVFILYPFSYQAVFFICTTFEPLVVALMLATLLFWYEGRSRPSHWFMAAAVLTDVAALWTHEYAAMLLPFILAIELFLWLRKRIGRPTLWLGGPVVAELVYVSLWFTIQKPQKTVPTTSDRLWNAGVWMQDFGYPFSGETNRLAAHLSLSPSTLAILLGLVGTLIGLGLYLAARRGLLGIGLIACGAIAFLPAAYELTNEYVLNGPRLLYATAPAAATFWGLLPWLVFRNRSRWLNSRRLNLAWRVFALACIGVLLYQSVSFIQPRLRMLDRATTLVDGIIQQGRAHPNGKLLFINVPSWFAPKSQRYPLGHLGIQIEPNYVGLNGLIYVATGEHVTAASRSLAPNVSGWLYDWGPHGPPIAHAEIDQDLRQGYRLAVAELYHDGLAVREPGQLMPGKPRPASHEATFGDGTWLLSSKLERQGNLLTIDTSWYAASRLPDDAMLWFQVVDAGGKVVAEHKDYALDGMSPPRLWQVGDRVDDSRVIDLSDVKVDGPLRVRLALVSTKDGSLLPLSGAPAGMTNGDWLTLGAVQ